MNEGNPISESDQSILFNPFARTRSAQIGSQKGWGLGLTLVKGIKLHPERADLQSVIPN